MLEKIQKLLMERGIRQTALEVMAGLPRNRFAKWKGGRGEPTARQIWRIADALGVPVEYLLNDALDEPPAPPALDEAERAAVRIVRALQLTEEDVIRRLFGDRPALEAKGEPEYRPTSGGEGKDGRRRQA